MKTTVYKVWALVFFFLVGCGEAPVFEAEPPVFPADTRIIKNYLGAPAGEELPVSFGLKDFNGDEVEMKAYIEKGNAFLAAKTAVEMEMGLAVSRSNNIEDAENVLQSMVDEPTGSAADLPRFVLEQIAAFKLMRALLDKEELNDKELSSLANSVEVLRKNRNASVIQVVDALKRLEGSWSQDRLRRTAEDFLAAQLIYGQCDECSNKGGPEVLPAGGSPLVSLRERHQSEVDGAVALLRRY